VQPLPQHLDAEEIPSSSSSDVVTEVGQERGGDYRVRASQAASTRRSQPLTRAFRPSKFGYTREQFDADYPGLDAEEVLESFLSWYIAKGETSRNWLERFWLWSRNATQRIKDTPNELGWIDAAEEHAKEIARAEAEFEAQEREQQE
jgi:hypothetical protein